MTTDYKYKTDPFLHQDERFRLYRDRDYHAVLWEQRTGKSKVTIDTTAWRHLKGDIIGALLIAPNGVHINWAKNEVPTHMPDYIGCEPVVYVSTPNAAQRKELDRLRNGSGHGLRFLSMNIEALRTPKGFEFAKNFLLSFRSIMIVDEGSIIKTWNAAQTEAILKLSVFAPIKRLLNGTPVTQSPLDIFSQFLFLDKNILRTTSWYAFRNRYAVLETQGQMKRVLLGKIAGIAATLNAYPWGAPVLSEEKGVITAGQQHLNPDGTLDFTVKGVTKMLYRIDWRCGNRTGHENVTLQPGDVYQVVAEYQRLDELQALIKPFSDRVLKAECLDLPEKIYQKRYVELSTKQRKMYDDLKRKCVAEMGGRAVTASNPLTKMLRLQQIIGGFFVPDQNLQLELFNDNGLWTLPVEEIAEKLTERLDAAAIPIEDNCPRLVSLMDDIAQTEGKVLIWARFRPEIAMIAKALGRQYGPHTVGQAHGGIPSDIRQQIIDDFQKDDSELRFIVANPQCKGVSRGQNLCKAVSEYYYSNSFSLEDRLQSEDRPHSPGQTKNLAVVDMVAPGTLDEKVIGALRGKKELADLVTGDKLIEWI